MCHAMEWVNTGGCALPLPVGQTITSQQSELPGHSRKCNCRFLAVPMEIHTSPCSRYGTREHRSSAATCWTQRSNEGTAPHMRLFHKAALLSQSNVAALCARCCLPPEKAQVPNNIFAFIFFGNCSLYTALTFGLVGGD